LCGARDTEEVTGAGPGGQGKPVPTSSAAVRSGPRFFGGRLRVLRMAYRRSAALRVAAASLKLVHDPAWSNEGLFALLQGILRLEQIGGNRVNVPAIEWQLVS
jgi:hypothetical protein